MKQITKRGGIIQAKNYSLGIVALVIVMFVMQGCAHRAHASGNSLRVLFIGNSFTYVNDMPNIFAELVKQRTPNIQVTGVLRAVGGHTLAQFSNEKDTMGLIDSKDGWNYVVLQEQSEMALYPERRQSMHDSCVFLGRHIKAARARPVLYMTWADKAKPENQYQLSTAYTDFGREIDALVVPAGDLFMEVNRAEPSINLYDTDNHHPSRYGSYLVACLFRDMLTETRAEVQRFRNAQTPTNGRDPIELKLERYADDFALKHMN
ncbi:MAG TPA: hypothetical protein V6C76_01165 [Drouetiella sp.]